VAAAGGAFELMNPEAALRVRRWLTALPLLERHRALEHAAERMTSASHHRLELVASVALAYAVLFTVEGSGLWLQKVWAEYLTILATTSFVPFEIYELWRRFTPLRLGALVVNVAIVVYLVVRRLRARRKTRSG
jgi:uncharacterized membrane protein (DUF2068 family)